MESGALINSMPVRMWYVLADSNGDSNASDGREFVKADMTPEDIVQAEQMVRDWKPGDCPSAEHRLGPSGKT